MTYQVLDLFSGIGGFSLGLERTGGFSTAAFCDNEPFAQKFLRSQWPGVPCYDDVRWINATRLRADGIERVDVITGGFPCQDISFQGKGLGLAGARSGLWSEMARLTSELRPRFTIVENVSALLDRGLGRVLGDLAEIGYDAEWHCIPASYVGAPHERDRIWVVAYPAEVHGSPPNEARGISLGQWIARSSGAVRGEAFCQHEGRSTISLGGEPALCNLDDGLSYSLVQNLLARLGNSVVPQIPELIGRAILAAEASRAEAA